MSQQDFFFSSCRALLGVADIRARQTLRSTLYFLGFREISYVPDAPGLNTSIISERPDLVISDIGLAGGEASKVMQDVRHGRIGHDPFLPMIAVTMHATKEAARAALNSGADDLLIYPWKAGYLDERIANIIVSRRPFVITSEYIGPDRRSAPRDGNEPEKLRAPNRLAAKAGRQSDTEGFEADLRSGMRALSEQRVARMAELLVRLTAEVALLAKAKVYHDRYTRSVLDRMTAAVAEIQGRAMNTRYSMASGACGPMTRAINLAKDAHANDDEPPIMMLESNAKKLGMAFKVPSRIMDDPLPPIIRSKLEDRIAEIKRQPAAGVG